MANSSSQKFIARNRAPRVQIEYDVELYGAEKKVQLPFVMGVMGDYSGDNTEGKKALKDRKFSQIDRDNFNDIMTKVNPQLRLKVENLLENDGSEMTANLDFKTMEDFEPHRIVEQLEPLKKLMDTRNKLRDLLTKADRSEDLEAILEDVLSNTNALSSLSSELGVDKKED